MSLRQRLYSGLLFLLVAVTFVISLSLSLSQMTWQFSISDEQTLQANLPGKSPQTVTGFYDGDNPIPALFHLALEEPDTVESYQEFNQLMSLNNVLIDALDKHTLSMHLEDGNIHLLKNEPRYLNDLSGMFWLQLGCGSLGFLICLLIKSARPSHQGINAFALTGLSYLLFTFSAAIYSTRNLLIDGQLFHTLSMLNHAGAMLFSASLTAFLWSYPKAIGKYAVSIFAYGVFVANIIVDGFQLVDGPAMGSYIWVFSLFLFGLSGSIVQWWFARKDPLDRGAVRWLLLSIYAGTVFFAGGIMLPILLNIPPVASQGLMFTTFLLMYGGLALGVLRYRLFDLERWWFSIWAWFLGGVAILLMDGILASFLTLSGTSALALATAIVGWLYFPIRQWFWHKMSYRKGLAIEAWLPKAVAQLVRVKTPLQLENAWQQSLQDLFQPLTIEQTTQRINDISIGQNGLQLLLPTMTQKGSLTVNNAGQGQRLFTKNDSKNAQTLLSMFQLMEKALAAKTEGANNERDRIRQDIHDDLGAKLLSILHSSQEPRPMALAKEALHDLKNLLQSIEIEPIAIEYAMAHWQQEARERIPEHLKLTWIEPKESILLELPPEYFSHLTRAIRECLTNALRHTDADQITIEIRLNNTIDIVISNNGVRQGEVVSNEHKTGGRGSLILQQRCESLGGSYQSHQIDQNWQVHISIPTPEQ